MKKMRKLIPAFAMLMVAAVMMSTASFAWFTMNEQVTATGMQVQAKAAGNLLISLNKMTATDKAISVNLDNTKQELAPVTYDGGAWKIPTDGADIDPTFGTITDGALTGATIDYVLNASDYFADYVVYLATAGTAMEDQTLWVKIEGIAGTNQSIAPAYTIAFYIDANDDGLISAGEYATSVSYKNFTADNVGGAVASVDVKADLTIPSTYGATADSKQGLRVFMRVYVDGNLDAPRTYAQEPVYKTYTATDKYDKATMADLYFYAAGDTSKTVDTSAWDSNTSLENYVSWDGKETQDGDLTDTKYVNNAWIPTGSTSFSVILGVKDDV